MRAEALTQRREHRVGLVLEALQHQEAHLGQLVGDVGPALGCGQQLDARATTRCDRRHRLGRGGGRRRSGGRGRRRRRCAGRHDRARTRRRRGCSHGRRLAGVGARRSCGRRRGLGHRAHRRRRAGRRLGRRGGLRRRRRPARRRGAGLRGRCRGWLRGRRLAGAVSLERRGRTRRLAERFAGRGRARRRRRARAARRCRARGRGSRWRGGRVGARGRRGAAATARGCGPHHAAMRLGGATLDAEANPGRDHHAALAARPLLRRLAQAIATVRAEVVGWPVFGATARARRRFGHCAGDHTAVAG